MAEIPPRAFEIPDYALWTVAGWLLTVFLSGWSGYRWGLRSQRHAELLRAKNAAFADIDKTPADAKISDNLRPVLRQSQESLRPLVYAISSQLNPKGRTNIETEWQRYNGLSIGAFPTTFAGKKLEEIQEVRASLIGPLDKLRKVIDVA